LGKFGAYADHLEALAAKALSGAKLSMQREELVKHLNGGAASALERAVPLATRRRLGAFFTGHSLRAELLGPTSRRASDLAIWDPACGAGDLLIAASDHLPVAKALEVTLRSWSSLLIGTDLQADFVRAARARLVLAAHVRGSRPTRRAASLNSYFPHLVVGNALTSEPPSVAVSDILLNPPFGKMRAPSDCEWASGSVARAAVFLEHCVSSARANTRVAAILPDVLRTGSRYRAWREWIEARAKVVGLRAYGRFTRRADVDVFLLTLVVRSRSRAVSTHEVARWVRASRGNTTSRIADHFEFRVGSVVPHRDAECGPRRRFLHARLASRFGEIRRIRETRQYGGRVFAPPFVVIHRTSSPSDGKRAIASIVLGKRLVAVENHLIVVMPRKGGLAMCRSLLEVLQLRSTTRFLNKRIRCRHLTVDAVGGIPWPMATK
jgi:hypothetical protein